MPFKVMLEIECGYAVQAEETPAMADAGKAAQEAVLPEEAPASLRRS